MKNKKSGPKAQAPSASSSEDITFDDLNLQPPVLKGIKKLGFIQPTPIQAGAIPQILKGRDVIGLAQTGTGKTAAFMLPIISRLMDVQRGRHIRALVVSPTRELVLQSKEHLDKLSRYVHLKGGAVFGGDSMKRQIIMLKRPLDILSATPGRLLDHARSNNISFKDIEIFVLDEVDRMLDMGFLPDIQAIIELLPKKRQNLVFSATLPKKIQPLVDEILKKPVTVQIGTTTKPAEGVRQVLFPVARAQKPGLLLALLAREKMDSVLIFSRTKRFANQLSVILEEQKIPAVTFHGDRSQAQRLRALREFKRGKYRVMVATDVAARGIDIPQISHVINYDVPDNPEEYIHRIGRTARAEAKGDAYTLVDPREEPQIKDIEKLLKTTLKRETLPDFEYKASKARSLKRAGATGKGKGSGPKSEGGRVSDASRKSAQKPKASQPKSGSSRKVAGKSRFLDRASRGLEPVEAAPRKPKSKRSVAKPKASSGTASTKSSKKKRSLRSGKKTAKAYGQGLKKASSTKRSKLKKGAVKKPKKRKPISPGRKARKERRIKMGKLKRR